MQNKKAVNRWLFIILFLFIITLILWNTYAFFNQLKQNERDKMQVWASAQQELEAIHLSNSAEVSETVLKALSSNTTTPMILYTHSSDSYDARNIVEKTNDSVKLRNKRIAYANQFAKEYKPLQLTYNGEILTTIYYGNSPIINKLKYYPAVLILILLLSAAVLYFFYKTSKSAEQNKLWAGMAKETAHQIGTPLSSLVGWTEILKTEQVNQEYVQEMEKDIARLETITERFSKIGSLPTLKRTNIVDETKEAFSYLQSRSSKLIEFQLELTDKPLYVDLNPQLYSWTIENLVKNGIDAMKGKGTITITVEHTSKNALIRVSDTGKGIPKRSFKRVFSPGYTTKKRGWGLGLSLVKRIIEEYHNGKIRVLRSTPGKGTTMEIALRLQQ
ncbi:MAG: HAMP domain-containing histidine kinase [Flavobacteriales bacterium]|nr:HAMP domain-containing histidine kinase [Flavobacteriales bacterium]